MESLRKIKEFKYDIVCYTASISHYANAVLDIFDKNNEIFSLRLYRENCVQTKLEDDKVYIKDLRIFQNVDLKDMIIIDNSILSFAFHLDNGIPILPYYSNKGDRELTYLVHYLGSLINHTDISAENKKFIKYNYESNNLNQSIIIFDSSVDDTNTNNFTLGNIDISLQECNLNELSYFSGSENEFEGIKNQSLKNMYNDL